MIVANRDGAARRRVDEQNRRGVARGDRVEQVQLEAEELVGSERGREDYVEHSRDYSRLDNKRRRRALKTDRGADLSDYALAVRPMRASNSCATFSSFSIICSLSRSAKAMTPMLE